MWVSRIAAAQHQEMGPLDYQLSYLDKHGRVKTGGSSGALAVFILVSLDNGDVNGQNPP